MALGTASVLLMISLLSGAGFAAASSQSYTFGLAGGFANVATQSYTSTGNTAVYAALSSSPISVTSFTYSIDAQVQGNSVSGSAKFNLKGQGVSASVDAQLVGMLPGVGLPLTCNQTTFADCTSTIAAFYTGLATVTLTVGGATTVSQGVPVLFESAYTNPFGGPLYMGVPGQIDVAATYNSAISHWDNAQSLGTVYDANANPVGQFSLTSKLTEDLRSGSETDTGQITLSGFSSPYQALNSVGQSHGNSVIPTAGEIDCTASLGLPIPPGITLCLLTGSHSTGSFNLGSNDGNTRIQGTYDTSWTVPAYGFTSIVTAKVIG